MLETYFTHNRTRAAYRAGFAGPYLDDFTLWLQKQGYRHDTIRRRIPGASQFVSWAQFRGCHVQNLNAESLVAFRRHLATCGRLLCASGNHTARYLGAKLFLAFVQSEGIGSAPDVASVPPPQPTLVVEFEQWMRVHRGVSEQTLLNYRRYIIDVLQTIGNDPERFEAKSLRAFILARARHSSIAQAKYVVTAVRMFLRYLIAMGQRPPGLDAALPCIAQWRLSTLPKYVPAEAIDHVLSVCDPSTPQGARDKAILLLLARLGLRAGDIARLSLIDIDWRDATLRVTGKSRRAAYLPLPQEVGEALLHYLEHGRPPHPDHHVFLSVVAPWAPLSRCGVSSVAAQALRRAGVDTPSFGAHVFRHSAATALLRQGVPLQTISDILRHTSMETTAHYAKVDVDLLRQVARPWPEGTSC